MVAQERETRVLLQRARFLILGYKDLVKAWKTGKISFSPDIERNQIGISSIDLRLGYEVSKLQFRPGVTVNPAIDDFDSKGLFTKDDFRQKDALGKTRLLKLEPNEFMVAFTLEEIHLPNNIAAEVEGRSRLARWGLAVHTTAPHIDPIFVGQIALELFNHGPFPMELRPGTERVCHLILHEMKSPVPASVAKSMGTFVRQKEAYQKPRGN